MTTPLKDCVIALCGRFDQTHAKIGVIIKKNGGQHSTKVSAEEEGWSVTHLVTTAKDIEAQAKKVQEARKFPDIKIVSFDWLTASVDNQIRADEAHFSFGELGSDQDDGPRSTSPMPPIQKDTKGKGRKRPRTPALIEEDESHYIETPAEWRQKKRYREMQRAKSGSILIPVDEACPLAGTHRVYIGEDGMIYDASVFKTHKGRKVNKYYRLQVLDSGAGDYKTWAGWRKRSKKGDGYIFGDGSLDSALGFFEKTFRKKVGVTWSNRFDPAGGNRQQGYYRLTERKFEDDSDDDCRQPDSSLDRSVQQLMELIFNRQYFADTLRELNYDTDKLPLGKLTKCMLDKGLEILGDIGGLLVDSSVNNTRDAAIAACSDAYYNLIPHDFGQNRPPVISSEEALKKEISFIESLCDMKITDKIREDNPGTTTKNVLDCQLAGLGVHEMTPLNVASGGTRQEEFELLREYLIRSHGRTHHLSFQVPQIFRIERDGEEELLATDYYSFNKGPYAEIKNTDRRLLWHGSPVTNYGGILSQGLRIAPPEAPVNAYAFGKGIYLVRIPHTSSPPPPAPSNDEDRAQPLLTQDLPTKADISSKSANDCHSHTSNNTGLLLLCEVELGTPMLELDSGRSDAADLAKRQGCLSAWGKGATVPSGWKDAGCVNEELAGVMMPDTTEVPGPADHAAGDLQYNEYIVYDVNQVKLRYLCLVEMIADGGGMNYKEVLARH